MGAAVNGEEYRPQLGDTVRVTLEGEVTTVWGGDDYGITLNGNTLLSNSTMRKASVEKVEPPIEVFQPGDTIRSKAHPRVVFSLGYGGCFDHLCKLWRTGHVATFTSEFYDRVEFS